MLFWRLTHSARVTFVSLEYRNRNLMNHRLMYWGKCDVALLAATVSQLMWIVDEVRCWRDVEFGQCYRYHQPEGPWYSRPSLHHHTTADDEPTLGWSGDNPIADDMFARSFAAGDTKFPVDTAQAQLCLGEGLLSQRYTQSQTAQPQLCNEHYRYCCHIAMQV